MNYQILNSIQAVLFIITMLETFPSERNMHIPLLNKAISDSSTRVFAAIKERFLPNIFKKPELRSWFFECYDQICGKHRKLEPLKYLGF